MGGTVMKINKAPLIFKMARFPAIMTIISFILFIAIYLFVTMTAIEPYYFMGLVFAIPFVSFGIITFFSVTGRLKIITSSLITSILIFVLGFAMLFVFLFITFDAATTTTTDISKYERVLKLTGYPNNLLTEYFPNKIPDNAKDIIFSYNPAFLQGGEMFGLKFKIDINFINSYINELSQKAKWIGKSSENQALSS